MKELQDSQVPDQLAGIVIEHSVDGLLVIDSDGFVRFANPAARALFAGRGGNLEGFHIGAPASERPVEMVLPGRDRSRYVEMRSAEITWKGRRASLASLRDITEHEEGKAALAAGADDLRERNAELMRFNGAAVGRELRMIELKEEINELCRRLGEAPRYRAGSLQGAGTGNDQP